VSNGCAVCKNGGKCQGSTCKCTLGFKGNQCEKSGTIENVLLVKEIFKNIGGKNENNDGAIVGANAFHL
jgi:hypothetical protein